MLYECLDNNQERFEQGEEFVDQGPEQEHSAEQGKPFTHHTSTPIILLCMFYSIFTSLYVLHLFSSIPWA